MHDNVLGLVLAGGLSRRMEGPEKSLLKLGEQTLVERVSNHLSRQVGDVLINANGDPERFAFLNLPVAADTIEGFAGPLAGILAGMRWAKANSKYEWILSAAADTPFFPNDYADQMLNSIADKKIALASSFGRNHPVFGLWHVSIADTLEAFLESGERKVMLFVKQHPNCIVEFDAVERTDPFFNVNVREDLVEAKKMLNKGC